MPRPDLKIHAQLSRESAERGVSWGKVLLERGNSQGALAIADAVLAETPEVASAWHLRGLACSALNRFDEAVEAFCALLSAFPDFSRIRLKLANIYIELGQYDNALAHLQETIRREPDFAAAHANLGSLHMRLGRYDLAEAPLRRALALDPGIVASHQNMAAILALRDDYKAQLHRDIVYRGKQIFAEPSLGGNRNVLILCSSGRGNVPYAHLLPRTRYNRVLWCMDYALPGQENDLPAYDLVFNAVADPDAAPVAQGVARRFAAKCTKPFINPPSRIARTFRSAIATRLKKLPDVAVPRTRRFVRGARDARMAVMESGFEFPLILRPAGRHGGEGVKLARQAAELDVSLPSAKTFYATEFQDYRSVDGWYRKYRVIFVDREPYPYHLAIGGRWLLHYRTADMQADAARRKEEEDFLRDPSAVLGNRAMEALAQIGITLDLDFAGIDFSLLPDGRILVFEANATMLVHPEEDPQFAYKNLAVDAILSAVEAMITRKLDRVPQIYGPEQTS